MMAAFPLSVFIAVLIRQKVKKRGKIPLSKALTCNYIVLNYRTAMV